MESERKTPQFKAGLIFAFFSGGLSLLSLTALLLVFSIALPSDAAQPIDFITLVAGRMWVLIVSALALMLVSSSLGFYVGEIIGAPLKRAVRNLEALRSLEAGRDKAAAAVAGLQTLSDACRKLADSMEVRSQCSEDSLAEAAHGLKAPLARMLVQLELLKRRNGTAPEIENMERDIFAMQDSLRKTLDFVRCGVPENRTLERTDTLRLFSEAIEKNMSMASEKGQSLRLVAPADPVWIMADAAGLAQVLDEMIFNALRYTPTGGNIVAAISAGAESVTLSVSDDGPGVSDDELGRIFDPFFCGESARASGAVGSGLGLALASRRCTDMQAAMQARRSPSGGLCVSIEFPKKL